MVLNDLFNDLIVFCHQPRFFNLVVRSRVMVEPTWAHLVKAFPRGRPTHPNPSFGKQLHLDSLETTTKLGKAWMGVARKRMYIYIYSTACSYGFVVYVEMLYITILAVITFCIFTCRGGLSLAPSPLQPLGPLRFPISWSRCGAAGRTAPLAPLGFQ